MTPNQFTSEENQARTKTVRQELSALIEAIQNQIDPTRETSLVITKLQEARMWAGQNLANYSDEFQKSKFADKPEGGKLL